jgi:tetratricopeptide (TPR) repeat protein
MSDRVFICYDREDEEFVLKLAASLKSRGVPVWLDQWDIPSGADWDLTIDNALYDCFKFIIVLSPKSVDSIEVRSELLTALDEKKPIVPILYQSCRIPRQLRLIQRADFTTCNPNDSLALNKVLRALGMDASAPKEPKKIENCVQNNKIDGSIGQKNNGDNAQNWCNKGIALADQKKHNEAIKCCDKAIRLNPDYADAWNNKGLALKAQKKYDEAIKCYDKAIQLDTNYAVAKKNRELTLRMI